MVSSSYSSFHGWGGGAFLSDFRKSWNSAFGGREGGRQRESAREIERGREKETK